MPYPIRKFSPDQVYLVTSRCTDSMLLLRPDPAANEVILEWLVRGVRLYKVELFAQVWTSNHVHLLVRCPKGNLDQFMRFVLSHVATELNKLRGRSGSMFSRRYSAEPIQDNETVLDKALYILLNPVKAHLVDKVEEWPGISSAAELLQNQVQTAVVFDRTAWHAAGRPKDRSSFQEKVPLPVAVLPGFEDMVPRQRARTFRKLVREGGDAIRDERRREGRRPLGRRGVLAADPRSRPLHSKKSPRPLCHAATREAREEYRQQYAEFVALYRVASDRFRAGDFAVVFPAGSFPPWYRGAAG